jgi:hypothetical protein
MFKRFVNWLKKIFNIKAEPTLDSRITVPSYKEIIISTISNLGVIAPFSLNPNPGFNALIQQHLDALTDTHHSPLAQQILVDHNAHAHINLVAPPVPYNPGPNGWSFFVPAPDFVPAPVFVPHPEDHPIDDRPMRAGG